MKTTGPTQARRAPSSPRAGNSATAAGRAATPCPASHAKALAARATGFGVGVGKLEPSRNQLGGKIQFRSLQVECGLRIDQNRHVRAAHQDVALFGLFDEAQFVAQAVATPAADRHPQVIALLFAGDERPRFYACGLGQAHQIFVPRPHAFGQRARRRRNGVSGGSGRGEWRGGGFGHGATIAQAGA